MHRFTSLVLVACCWTASPVHAEIKLVATGQIAGNATDKSGLTDKLEEGTPHNRLGGFGSAIAHVKGNRYVVVPDRGPKDGASIYQCRFHLADITIAGDKIDFDLKETVILRTPSGQPYLGDQRNLTRRLDAEGVRVSPKGTLYVSDEYGPKILEFDFMGKQLREFNVRPRFLAETRSGDPAKEAKNKTGRTPNRGFEGLALTPKGKLVAILQSPLLQDGGPNGLNSRILEIDPNTGATREFVYPLTSTKHGVNEILAISETTFLVLERDATGGKKRSCQLFRIDLAKATNVSAVDQLPANGLPPKVIPVTKTPFLDLAMFGLTLPEKVEGICWGADFADGRRLLLVTTDNDFTDQPSMIYAFSVEPSDLASR